ncbi:hypothetical protein BST27_28425 [Mycobacterium intermedium]|uniref:Uncharacterized protein n=1 Tax=Mycobacterium intermedium TaxID=28445 RepID=A0A1E3SID5_MYCIE|nr:hypothetical protein BHQ20_07320 [Mycobacterium intermedium]OPE49446.1 hypothetical protein BV508_14160 [Mycobacterium intermedium]ORA93976.1 hypothetical protein BST27_28425 [Mycobacterium intermedium]
MEPTVGPIPDVVHARRPLRRVHSRDTHSANDFGRKAASDATRPSTGQQLRVDYHIGTEIGVITTHSK